MKWFMAAHSAPKEVSKVDVESFHKAIGTETLKMFWLQKQPSHFSEDSDGCLP